MKNYGVAFYLLDLAEKMKQKLELFNPQQFTVKLRDKIILIDVALIQDESDDRDAFTNIVNKDENHFLIFISDIKVNFILHELKHIDRMIARNYTPDSYFYFTNIGIDVTQHVNGVFWKNREKLIDCLYYFSPDEFESQYNDMYYRLKELINKELEIGEKRMIVDDFLNEQEIYNFYKHFLENGGVNLENFFKTKCGLRKFLKTYCFKMEQYKNSDGAYFIWKRIKPRYRKEKLESVKKDIESSLNKVLIKGYKKFHRLYTIFLND